MRTITSILPLALLLSACGTMRETASVRDDVYDLPDRQAMAAAEATTPQPEDDSDAYYDPQQAQSTDRDYYDMTYNDPYYYNYGRFGFGTGIGSYGPGYGMFISYGWPTSFGSMSVGFGYGAGYGYDPYGYYGYGDYGYGYGGYGMGYYPYQGLWGGYYAPPGGGYVYDGRGDYSSGVVYGHRPSMSAGSGASGQAVPSPRLYRGSSGLLEPDGQPRWQATNGNMGTRPSRTITPPRSKPSDQGGRSVGRTSPNWNLGGGSDSPSRSGDGGGGRTIAPRPR